MNMCSIGSTPIGKDLSITLVSYTKRNQALLGVLFLDIEVDTKDEEGLVEVFDIKSTLLTFVISLSSTSLNSSAYFPFVLCLVEYLHWIRCHWSPPKEFFHLNMSISFWEYQAPCEGFASSTA